MQLSNFNVIENTYDIVIMNGELHSPHDYSTRIDIQNDSRAIIIAPRANDIINLYCIHCSEESIEQTIIANFYEPNAQVNILGLYQGDDKQVFKITTQMNHATPHCTSKQIWKGVLKGHAKAVFDAKIIVQPQAQKTVAHLSNRNLLLSKTAEINTKPALEIYADDVKCSHGATIGCLDENALFYLRSRGISDSNARELLVQAFVNEIIDAISDESIKRYIQSKVSADVL